MSSAGNVREIDSVTGGIPQPAPHPQACVEGLSPLRNGSESLAAGQSNETDDRVSLEDEQDPCPTPLSWQQVLTAFREESTPWRLEVPGDTIVGRSCGEGPPLYFLNGLGGTHELFALSVWLLRDEFRCVLFDYRTSGNRADRGGGMTVRQLSDDLFAVADLHGDADFHLYATSFGGTVALNSMLAQPGRIRSAVIQGGFAYRRLTVFERFLGSLCSKLPGRLERLPFRRLIQTQNHRPWFPPFDETRWRFFEENTGGVPLAVLARRAAGLNSFDARERLCEIKQPVLLVRTEGDGMVSERCQQELEAGLGNVQTEWLHSCGHLPYLTHPHRLAKLVRSFLLPEKVEEVQ